MTRKVIKKLYTPIQKIRDDLERKRNQRLMMSFALKIKVPS